MDPLDPMFQYNGYNLPPPWRLRGPASVGGFPPPGGSGLQPLVPLNRPLGNGNSQAAPSLLQLLGAPQAGANPSLVSNLLGSGNAVPPTVPGASFPVPAAAQGMSAGTAGNTAQRYTGNLVPVNLPGLPADAKPYLDKDFVGNVQTFIDAAKKRGVDLKFNEAFRTPAQQAALVDNPNAVTPVPLKNGDCHSLHCGGLAVDVNFSKLKDIPGGLTGDQQRQAIRDAATAAGLKRGEDFKKPGPDAPHFYMPSQNPSQVVKNAQASYARLKQGSSGAKIPQGR